MGLGKSGSSDSLLHGSSATTAQENSRFDRALALTEAATWEDTVQPGDTCSEPEPTQPDVVRFYSERGPAERGIKWGKHATYCTRLSRHRFRAHERRSQLGLLTYNLDERWRRLVLLKKIDHCLLTSLEQLSSSGRLLK